MGKTKKMSSVLVIALAIAMTAMPICATAGQKGSARKNLNGAWDATVDFQGTPVRAMFSFFKNGVVMESDNPGFDPNFGGLALSNGNGTWRRAGKKRFDYAYQRFAYDVDGVLQQIYRSKVSVKLDDPDNFSGEITIEVYDADGTLLYTIESLDIVGNRLHLIK